MPQSYKTFTFSLLAHIALCAGLWFGASDLVAVEMPAPTVIDATILPPPAIESPKPALEKAPAAPASDKNISTTKQEDKPSIAPATSNDKPASKATSTPAVGGNDNTASKAASAPAVVKSTPIDAPIKDGGFQIKYDVSANYKGMDAAGGAVFTFSRTGATYKAVLSSKASVAKFNAISEGEIRDNTVATTRFSDGRTIVGREQGGSNFGVDYVERKMSFGTSSGTVSPLVYDTVYDYLSAMVYIQALLQSKQGQVSSLQLPIGKRSTIEMARVTFESPEHLSTMEGAFEDAIPATIVISSGSIKSIKMWFVPAKKYRPLQIEIGFGSGNVRLISRESN